VTEHIEILVTEVIVAQNEFARRLTVNMQNAGYEAVQHEMVVMIQSA
jgi:hypothetical protein